MQNYKELKVWAAAHQFVLGVYEKTKRFPKEEMAGITNQLRRSASSVPANIAEGCGRNSQSDFAKVLQIALGSANESGYFLLFGKDLFYLEEETLAPLYKQINEIKAMLIALIQKVRATNVQANN